MRFAKQENRALVPRVPGKRSHIVSLLYSVFGKKSRGFPIFSPRAGFSRDFTAERALRFRPRPRPERQKAPKEHPASSARSAFRFRRRSHGECDLPPKEYRGVPASPGGCPCAGPFIMLHPSLSGECLPRFVRFRQSECFSSVNKNPQIRKTYIFFANIPEFAKIVLDKQENKGYNGGVGGTPAE